jgi:hypothetical protein
MRREHDVLERQEIRIHLGLLFVDVQRRARDYPVLERPGERCFVHDRTARRVDEIRGSLHAGERGLVDQMPRLGRQRTMNADDVGRRQQPVDGDRIAAGGSLHIRVHDAESECGGARSHRPADPAVADDSQLSPPQLHAEHEVEGPALPSAAAHEAVALRHAPRDVHDQRPGQVGSRLGEDIRRVGNDNASRARGVHIDVVEADCDVGDHFEAARRVHHLGRHHVREYRHDSFLVVQTRFELVW